MAKKRKRPASPVEQLPDLPEFCHAAGFNLEVIVVTSPTHEGHRREAVVDLVARRVFIAKSVPASLRPWLLSKSLAEAEKAMSNRRPHVPN